MKNEELCYLTVSELSRKIASREVSPVELTKAYLERTQELNPKLSVVITLTPELAMKQAAAAEAEVQKGTIRGPLHGIPFAVKDLLDTKGVRTTGGSYIYKDRVPDRDSAVIEKLTGAGGVLTAKLAMSEFASGRNNNDLVGHPHNPWKLDRSPSGSSSGPGAAAAAGLAGFTIGSETGGSIMGPSGANGVAGLRPTSDRVSRYGVMTLSWSMDKLGPLARSVEDIGHILQVMAGYDPRDRSSSRDAAFAFRSDPGPVKGRRLGLVRAEFDAVPAANRRVFDQALDVLRQAGYVLEDVALPDRPYQVVYNLISNTEAGTNFKQLFNDGRINHFYDVDKRADWMAASMMPASDYITALRIRALIRADADELTARYGAILAPTNATGSGPIGAALTAPLNTSVSSARTRAAAAAEAAPATRGVRGLNTMGNLTGLPGLSFPCGFDAEGMPLGMHVAARAWDEQSALDVGMVFQRDTNFHKRHPTFRA
jgi:aspartyl-tRNA(Asn)/glutamyl-tRNA(Gln) amidotransferase subunit A